MTSTPHEERNFNNLSKSYCLCQMAFMKVKWNSHPLIPASNKHLVCHPSSNLFQILVYGQPENYALPASHAMKTEIKQAAKNFADGMTPVAVLKRIWRPQVKSIYEELEDSIDPLENLDFLFREAGKMVLKHKHSLP
jgi:hypothetical protein